MNVSDRVLGNEPWPNIPLGSIRLWDSGTAWNKLNPQPGVYNWSPLDAWFEAAQVHGVTDILYTFGKTPAWASTFPNDPTCDPAWGPGACDPPDDVKADGSGTDQHWKDFVSAIATHAAGRIHAWEIWNEPKNLVFWTGTPAQLARMAQDARMVILAIDPKAMMVAPASRDPWLTAYLSAGGALYADVMNVHAYPQDSQVCGQYPQTSGLPQFLQNIRGTLASFGQDKKPLWNAEASWGRQSDTCFTDPDLQAAFLAQYYVMNFSQSVSRFYWYQWDNQAVGTLWSPSRGTLAPGMAYERVEGWLTGVTPSAPCAASGAIWTCSLKGANGYEAEVIWDTSQSCNDGTCATVDTPVGTQYTKYKDLAGRTVTLTNHTAPIGMQPILLENQ